MASEGESPSADKVTRRISWKQACWNVAALTVSAAVLLPFLIAVPPWLLRERENRRAGECAQHLRELGQALQMYLDDYDLTFPPPVSWCDVLVPYLETGRDAFVCPEAKNRQCSYALNSAVALLRLKKITNADRLVVFFESDVGWNAAGGPELLPERSRHFGGDRYLFADRHGTWEARKKLLDGSQAKEPSRADWVIWEPKLKDDTGNTRPAP